MVSSFTSVPLVDSRSMIKGLHVKLNLRSLHMKLEELALTYLMTGSTFPNSSFSATWWNWIAVCCFEQERCSTGVMTRSRLSPEPVPVPAQPRTGPRHFITDEPHVTSCHMTHSHHVHPQMRMSASWHTQPLVVHAVFLPAL